MVLKKQTFCNTSVNAAQKVDPDLSLKLVQVVFRHGARTPLYMPKYLPKVRYSSHLLDHAEHTLVPFQTIRPGGQIYEGYDLQKTEKKFYGRLTAPGAQQMYNLGCRIRQKYVQEQSFLQPQISDEVYVRSTQIPRAIESARCTLAGKLSFLILSNTHLNIILHLLFCQRFISGNQLSNCH